MTSVVLCTWKLTVSMRIAKFGRFGLGIFDTRLFTCTKRPLVNNAVCKRLKWNSTAKLMLVFTISGMRTKYQTAFFNLSYWYLAERGNKRKKRAEGLANTTNYIKKQKREYQIVLCDWITACNPKSPFQAVNSFRLRAGCLAPPSSTAENWPGFQWRTAPNSDDYVQC